MLLIKNIFVRIAKKANDGTWHNIAAVFDRANLKVDCYIDGNRTGRIPLASNFQDMYDGGGTVIGKQLAGANFVGSLDDVRVYGSNLDGMAIK